MTVKNLYKNKDEEELLKLAEPPAAETEVKPLRFDDSAYQAAKPTYQSSYADRIDGLLTDLENRPAFSYDPESDPLYRQYRSQYQREGSRAVEDTLAAAAAMAGGMNSYAVTAAQQAGDYYNAKLMDVLPELAELAYQMYRADYDEDVSNLKLLQSQEAEDYDRYQDALTDWYAELEAAYQQYRDSVADSKWRESFDYEQARDEAADRQWRENFDYEKAQDALAYEKWREQMDYQAAQDALDRQQWQQEFDYEQARDTASDNRWLQELLLSKSQNKGGSQSTGGSQTQTEPAVTAPAADRYAGTDYYQDAIDAALRGDREAAEAALAKRAEKMSSPDYRGTGGGTSMAEASEYIDSLLEISEAAEIPEAAASAMKSKSEWKESRAAGVGPEAEYATYEDYVSDYLRYLTEAGA
ncbi:MAG: hypothetical protein E7445_02390 [Ruminococcaceae bacterium]|nr:hypothetical protein [Oscillospiraceae bacterium]